MNLMKSLKAVSGSRLIWTFVISIVSVAFLGIMTYEATKASVQVTQDGETQLIRTHANTVGELLSELEVTVQKHDQLSHGQTEAIQFGMDIVHTTSKTIKLAIDDQKAKQYHTTADTVGEFFKEENLNFKERDELSHDQDAGIKNDMDIQVDKAIQVTLNDGGEKETVWTTASTVGEFLKNQQVTLDELDKLSPAKGEKLAADSPVTVTRIEKVTDIVEEEVDYTVETRNDHSLPKGEKRVISSGEKGVLTKKYEVTLENGKETKRELIKKTVEKDSKKKIVAIGTKVETPTYTTSSQTSPQPTVSRGESSGARTLYMHATAYTADCSGCSGVTATGINLKANPGRKVVAVDPSVIPLGSRVWVEGYGYAIAGDTGSAINGNRIDLFIPSRSKALGFGSRNVKVKILD